MADSLSDFVKGQNLSDAVNRLRLSGYMSPQNSALFDGHGFSCKDCDWYRENPLYSVLPVPPYGSCTHPKIRATVEYNGCSNLFTWKGVHTD